MRRHYTTIRILFFWFHVFSPANLARVPFRLFRVTSALAMVLCKRSRPYGNIQLIAFPPHQVSSLATIVEALELIREKDPLRFKRIETYVRRVVVGNWRRMGFYNPIGRVCGVRIAQSAKVAGSLAVLGYASTIIHEATHAKLDRLRFSPTGPNLHRIEMLCLREERRFLERFPDVRNKLPLVFGYLPRKSPRTSKTRSG